MLLDLLADSNLPSPDAILGVLLLLVLFWFLNMYGPEDFPQVTLNAESIEVTNGFQLKNVLRKCPILRERLFACWCVSNCSNFSYRPPLLWGKNGHIQTAAYGVLGHKSLKRVFDERHEIRLPDGTTITFDVFEPAIEHPSQNDYTIAMCPGICNSSGLFSEFV